MTQILSIDDSDLVYRFFAAPSGKAERHRILMLVCGVRNDAGLFVVFLDLPDGE